MSEILITGIEMPKEGEVLYLAITSGGVVGRSEKALNYIPQNAKARELPTHGELCDKDKLKEEANGTYLWSQALEAIKNAHVVLEATE